ncbi:MAG: MFS transporter [Bryobacteraceae bacterium]|nr:MFS transporter [Bryobacteraceae bacterium]
MSPSQDGIFRALRHRNFRVYLSGLVLSLVGTWMQNTAQAWLVYRLTRSEVLLGTTQFASHIPVLLLGPLAGLAADRFPRHRIVTLTQALFLLQATCLAWLTLTDRITVPLIIAMAALLGVINAFDVPARQSMLPALVSTPDLLNAISLNSLCFQAARLVGPVLGGFAVAWWGEGICFSVNALSFVAVLASLLSLRIAPQVAGRVHPPALESLREGWRYLARSPRLRRLLALSAAVNLSIAPLWVLLPVLAEGIFGRGARGVGLLTAGVAVGAIAAMLGLARMRASDSLARVILWSTAGLGMVLCLFFFAPTFWAAWGLMALVGFTYMSQNAATNSAVQTSLEEEFRGRVMSTYTMTVVGAMPIGALFAGWLASHFGARETILLGGVGALVAAGFQAKADRS